MSFRVYEQSNHSQKSGKFTNSECYLRRELAVALRNSSIEEAKDGITPRLMRQRTPLRLAKRRSDSSSGIAGSISDVAIELNPFFAINLREVEESQSSEKISKQTMIKP